MGAIAAICHGRIRNVWNSHVASACHELYTTICSLDWHIRYVRASNKRTRNIHYSRFLEVSKILCWSKGFDSYVLHLDYIRTRLPDPYRTIGYLYYVFDSSHDVICLLFPALPHFHMSSIYPFFVYVYWLSIFLLGNTSIIIFFVYESVRLLLSRHLTMIVSGQKDVLLSLFASSVMILPMLLAVWHFGSEQAFLLSYGTASDIQRVHMESTMHPIRTGSCDASLPIWSWNRPGVFSRRWHSASPRHHSFIYNNMIMILLYKNTSTMRRVDLGYLTGRIGCTSRMPYDNCMANTQ